MFHDDIIKKFVLLVVLLNSNLYYKFFFVVIFFLPLLQDSAITWQNTNLKISFINFFVWFIRLSVKFFNNVWYIQNAHELHIKICFSNIVYCIFYIYSGVDQVSLFRDTGSYFTIPWVSRNFQWQKFLCSLQGSHI